MTSNAEKLVQQTYKWLRFVKEDYNNFVDEIMCLHDSEVVIRGLEGFIKIDYQNEEELFDCILEKLRDYLDTFEVMPLNIDNVKIYYFFGLCAFELFNTPHPFIWSLKAILTEIETSCGVDTLLHNVMIDKIIEIIKQNDIDYFKRLYGEYGVYTALSLLYKQLSA